MHEHSLPPREDKITNTIHPRLSGFPLLRGTNNFIMF